MLALQLVAAAGVFAFLVLSGGTAPERAFAALLAFLIPVSSGYATASVRPRTALVLIKGAFCAFLSGFAPLSLLPLPAILLELPGLFSPRRKYLPAWIALAIAAAAPALLLPPSPALLYLAAWAASLSAASEGLWRKARLERALGRAADLERRLCVEEGKRGALERAAAGQELLARLEERDRIAGELHDGLGHSMTSGILQLEAASLLLREDPDRAGEIMSRAAQALREGLETVRSSLSSLKPGAALLGENRLAAMLESFEADHGIRAALSVEGNPGSVPGRVWRVAEENLREALTNTLRHGSARRFDCRVSVLNRLYKVEFRDDGEPSPSFRKGMGLEGMEARAAEAGGTMIADASRGFSVIMLFPKEE